MLMESQRRKMIWFEITKRRLIHEQQSNESKQENPTPAEDKNPKINWEDEDDYLSQR